MHEIQELDQQEIADVAGGADWVDALFDGINSAVDLIKRVTGLN